MSLPWLVLRHVEHEHLGTLASVLGTQQIPYQYLDVFRGDPVPASAQDFGGIIAMGGPMGVYETEKYPFINRELDLIRSAATTGLPVIGICLGSQMIAAALGGRVYPGHAKEIGWYPVRVVPQQQSAPQDEFTAALPATFMAFHWHGDTFDLPPGATRLFESDLYSHQGFRWGANVLALQFHFEVDRRMIAEWLDDPGCRAELASVQGLSREAILIATHHHGAVLENLSAQYFSRVLKHVAALVAGIRSTA